MNTNVNLAAPLGALALLGTGFVLLTTALFLLYSVIVRKFGRARLALIAIVVISCIYLLLILAFSFASSDKVLARGEEKHFCELDCHLAYSVQETRQAKTLGTGDSSVTANGLFTVITIRTRFDEKTIGPNRGNGQLRPNSRVLTIIDGQGRTYFASPAAEHALEVLRETGSPLTTPLRPGESYLTTIAFDLPADIENPTLLINEGEWETRFVIGHENSLLHRKTRFQI